MVRNREQLPNPMDSATGQGKIALAAIPEGVVKTMANWWNQWYPLAGHRRLGRLLLTYRDSSPTRPRDQVSVTTIRLQPEDDLKAHLTDEGLRYTLSEEPFDSPAFFDVKETGGEVRIVLNTSHPAFPLIRRALYGAEANNLRRIPYPSSGNAEMALVLRAWSDVERRLPHGERRVRAQEAREDWGRVMRDLLMGQDAQPQ